MRLPKNKGILEEKIKRLMLPPFDDLSAVDNAPTQFHHPVNRFNLAEITAMNRALYILLLLHLHLYRLTLSAEMPIMFPSAACSDQLVIFSSCIPFIGASPNNCTQFPPQQCCDDVAAAFKNGSAICICYLILEPHILGFPLNSTKLLSLTSVCPPSYQSLEADFSLQKLCSVAESPPTQELSSNPLTENPTDGSTYVACSSTSSQTIHWLRSTVIGFILLLRFSISYQ